MSLTREELEEAFKDAASTLIGAASAYATYARQYKKRGPADPFFTKRLEDMNKAVARARRAYRKLMK